MALTSPGRTSVWRNGNAQPPQAFMNPSTSWLRHLGRALVAAVALWLVWVVWQPTYFTLPDDLVRPRSAEDLGALRPDATFLLEGVVKPAEPSEHAWQGRFAYLHRQRQDLSTGVGREQRVVDVEDWRPALDFTWEGGVMRFAADAYRIDHAPAIVPGWWPRKALGLARVDDWHKSSTGVRVGEAALAFGHVREDRTPDVEHLMASPVEKVVAKIGYENRLRRGLVLAFKIGLTLFCVAYGMPRRAK